AETDAQGLSSVIVRNSGLNVIAAESKLPVNDNVDIAER
ncbi:DUF4198 domain-containing protein, partial [Pseudomonas syringae pv. tagetis]